MSHLKRQEAPKKWPVKRKGTAFIVRSNFNIQQGVPVLIAIRDMLKLAQNRKEVKKAIYQKNILLNHKPIKDEKNSVLFFDVITIVPSNKNFRLVLSNKGKFQLEEIKKEEVYKKVAKIINKKTLKNKKNQINLSDGRNIISNLQCKVNDSALVNLLDKKIEKCLPLKEQAEIVIFAGKHIGVKKRIKKINLERKTVELEISEKVVNVLIKQLMVVE